MPVCLFLDSPQTFIALCRRAGLLDQVKGPYLDPGKGTMDGEASWKPTLVRELEEENVQETQSPDELQSLQRL